MNALLLALLLFQVGPQQNPGVITGVVRGENGLPAPGVRVYAIPVSDGIAAANPGTSMESLVSTDDAGRYRLQLAPGRYYIATGSVLFPTYYPGTEDLETARVISITARGFVENIDFSGFTPAIPFRRGGIPPLPRGSTGVLEGKIRFPDGTPAAGITVAAVAVAAVTAIAAGAPPKVLGGGRSVQSSGVRRQVNGHESLQTRTDAGGRYRLENLAKETYYIATGFSDLPVLLDGCARQRPCDWPWRAASRRRKVKILRSPSIYASFGFPESYDTSVAVNEDGTFEAFGVLPGSYSFEAIEPLGQPGSRTVDVADQPIAGLDLYIPIARLSGRILLDDGTPLSNPQIFGDAVVTTVTDPNIVGTTFLAISKDGTFTRLIEADEYRFYLRNMPDEYSIKSITYGTQDLLKATLKIAPVTTVNIEIRVSHAVKSRP